MKTLNETGVGKLTRYIKDKVEAMLRKKLTDGSVTRVGTETVGESNRPVYLNAGYPRAVTSVGEAYLSWGGKNRPAYETPSPVDAALCGLLGANRFAGAWNDGITIEYSRDGGATWLDYGAEGFQKKALCIPGLNANLVIGKATEPGISADAQLRVTFNANLCHIYTQLDKFIINVSTDGSQDTYLHLERAISSAPDDWIDMGRHSVGGWSGMNVININRIVFGSNADQTRYLRFTFTHSGMLEAHAAKQLGFKLLNIFAYGGYGWTTPSTLAKTGLLYQIDSNLDAVFPAAVTAQQFKGALAGNANSATNADMLDGRHAGVRGDEIMINCPFPTAGKLVELGYNTEENVHNAELYLKGLCRWAYDTYKRMGNISLFGMGAPGSSGTLVLHLYSSSGLGSDGNGGTDNGAEADMPRYCGGHYLDYSGYARPFGTTNGKWYFTGTYYGNVTGAASFAVKLRDARTIFGQLFDGSGDVSGDMEADNVTVNGNIDVAGYITAQGEIEGDVLVAGSMIDCAGNIHTNDLEVDYKTVSHGGVETEHLVVGSRGIESLGTVWTPELRSTGNVSVGGNASVSGDLTTGGKLYVTGRMDVMRDATILGVLECHDALSVGTELNVAGHLKAGGLIEAKDGIVINKSVSADGIASTALKTYNGSIELRDINNNQQEVERGIMFTATSTDKAEGYILYDGHLRFGGKMPGKTENIDAFKVQPGLKDVDFYGNVSVDGYFAADKLLMMDGLLTVDGDIKCNTITTTGNVVCNGVVTGLNIDEMQKRINSLGQEITLLKSEVVNLTNEISQLK